MSYRFAGFHLSLFGDIAMGTVAARILKTRHPDSHFTLLIGKDFAEMAPLFREHPHIDDVHVCSSPRNGFDETDIEWLKTQRFDHVFNPMADHDHSRPWWRERHQTLELAHMHQIPTEGESPKIVLKKWWESTGRYRNYVAISPFPAWYAGLGNNKALTIEQADYLVDDILSKGFKVLQIGHRDEPKLVGAEKPDVSYFQSVVNALECRGMVMGDSGLNWVLSGYDHPVVAWYGDRYYGAQWVHHIQPVNPNAAYLNAPTVSEIDLDKLTQLVQTTILDRLS